MLAKTLKRAAFGFLLGMLFGVMIVIIMSFSSGSGSLTVPDTLLALTGSEAGALLAQMLLSGAFGAIPMAGVSFYEIDSWGLLKQAVVHYVSYTVAFLAVGLCAGWLAPTVGDIGMMVGIFAVCHTIIWLIMYARYKSEVKELNAMLHETEQGIEA